MLIVFSKGGVTLGTENGKLVSRDFKKQRAIRKWGVWNRKKYLLTWEWTEALHLHQCLSDGQEGKSKSLLKIQMLGRLDQRFSNWLLERNWLKKCYFYCGSSLPLLPLNQSSLCFISFICRNSYKVFIWRRKKKKRIAWKERNVNHRIRLHTPQNSSLCP